MKEVSVHLRESMVNNAHGLTTLSLPDVANLRKPKMRVFGLTP